MAHSHSNNEPCFACLGKAEQRFRENGHQPGDNDDYLRRLYQETREGFHR